MAQIIFNLNWIRIKTCAHSCTPCHTYASSITDPCVDESICHPSILNTNSNAKFDVSLMTTWTYSGTYSLVIGGMRRHDPHVSSLQCGCWCCMRLYAPVCSHFRYLKNLMKVHLRGPALYNKKGALFQEESYLPRIFRSSSLNLHTFSSHSHCILMANFLS